MTRVAIALGSNLGDRLANLVAARDELKKIASPGESSLEASTYQTEPLLCPPGSPMFYNSVIEIAFEGAATDLLAITQSIEKKIGRAAAPECNAPRIIDIDLLYFGDEVIATDDLELPHPRIAQRRFVLQPLAEICPDRILPGQTQSIAKLLHDLKTDEPPLVFVK